MDKCIYNKIIDNPLHVSEMVFATKQRIIELLCSFYHDRKTVIAETYVYRLMSDSPGIRAIDFYCTETGKSLSILCHSTGTLGMEHYRLEDLDVDPTISVDTADETDAYYLAVDLLSMLGFSNATVSKDNLHIQFRRTYDS